MCKNFSTGDHENRLIFADRLWFHLTFFLEQSQVKLCRNVDFTLHPFSEAKKKTVLHNIPPGWCSAIWSRMFWNAISSKWLATHILSSTGQLGLSRPQTTPVTSTFGGGWSKWNIPTPFIVIWSIKNSPLQKHFSWNPQSCQFSAISSGTGQGS